MSVGATPSLSHELEPAPAGLDDVAALSARQIFWRRLRRDRVALGALAFVVLLLVVAVAAPAICKLVGAQPPNQQNLGELTAFGEPAPPGGGFLFGTDDLGRDVFSRTLYGARVSLTVALLTTGITLLVGTTLGLLAGYHGGRVDTLLSRTFDILLGFPVLLLALGLGAACSFGGGCLPVDLATVGVVAIGLGLAGTALLVAIAAWRRRRASSVRLGSGDAVALALPGLVVIAGGAVLAAIGGRRALIEPGLSVVVAIIVLFTIPYLGRIVRGQVISLKEREFVEAARSLGASDRRILFRHLLPNLVAPILVYATLLIPQAILFEAAMSFLGVGVQAPTASWGAMIAAAAPTFDTAWWYMAFPGLALLLTVLAFNLLGDGMQDALATRGGS